MSLLGIFARIDKKLLGKDF